MYKLHIKSSLLVASLYVMSISNVQATLINGSFENPAFSPGTVSIDYPVSIPGWQTTDRAFEIWSDGALGVTSYDGNQHAELNAFIAGTLYQNAAGISAGSQVGFEFAHRGRAGVETMHLDIVDLGIDNIFGTLDDTSLFSKNYSTGTSGWALYTSVGESPILALGNTVRFAYSAVGGVSVGNFLDAAKFGVDVVTVPEPTTLALLAFGLAGIGYGQRRSKTAA